MFIFVDGWGFVLFRWSVVFVATQVVWLLFLNICNWELVDKAHKCDNNVCVFELFWGALEVRNNRFCLVRFKFVLLFDQGELLLSRTVETDC